MKKNIIDNLKTIFFALIIALFIRSFFFQPFYIPSSSMEPGLLIGDRLFVSKYTYGYSRHSLPFSPKIYNKRIFEKKPMRGDVVVFKTPADNRTDYIKRLIGFPGDVIQIKDKDLYLNNVRIKKRKIETLFTIHCGNKILETDFFEETLPNGKKYSVGYVNFNNLVGKARLIFFSNDKKKGSFFKFWKWKESIRMERIFKKIL